LSDEAETIPQGFIIESQREDINISPATKRRYKNLRYCFSGLYSSHQPHERPLGLNSVQSSTQESQDSLNIIITASGTNKTKSLTKIETMGSNGRRRWTSRAEYIAGNIVKGCRISLNPLVFSDWEEPVLEIGETGGQLEIRRRKHWARTRLREWWRWLDDSHNKLLEASQKGHYYDWSQIKIITSMSGKLGGLKGVELSEAQDLLEEIERSLSGFGEDMVVDTSMQTS
jgi:hypothetical protein